MAWIGWQADIPSKPGQLALAAPVLRGVTGPARDEFLFDHMRSPATANLSWPIGDPSSLAVTVRAKWDAPREKPAGLAIRATGDQSVEIIRPADGFDAGALYEVTYTARDPAVLGLGFAATRDVVSFLRRSSDPANPLAAGGRPMQRAIGFGVSQSGRYLRDFLYLGFNEDLAGGMVFDGLMPHVAGGRRMATNVRFGLPGRNPRHPQDPAWQADTFPFTYQTLYDPLSGRRDGLMQRCRLNATCPRIIQTDSEHEWWASRASLLVTDLQGNHLDLPGDVRAYMIAGTPHFAEAGERMRSAPTMALPVNPMHAGAPMRALLTAMQAWITTGVEPPASRVPMRAHGTLVEASDAVPRNIPGLPYTAIHTGAAFTDPRSASGEDPRHLSGVRAARGQRRHGDRRHSHAAARRAARDLHRMESPRRRVLAPARCFRCRARWFRSPPPAPSARRQAIRVSPSPSATRTTPPMSPRSAPPPRGWWPSGCCCRRTPSAPSILRRRTDCRNCTDGGAAKTGIDWPERVRKFGRQRGRQISTTSSVHLLFTTSGAC